MYVALKDLEGGVPFFAQVRCFLLSAVVQLAAGGVFFMAAVMPSAVHLVAVEGGMIT